MSGCVKTCCRLQPLVPGLSSHITGRHPDKRASAAVELAIVCVCAWNLQLFRPSMISLDFSIVCRNRACYTLYRVIMVHHWQASHGSVDISIDVPTKGPVQRTSFIGSCKKTRRSTRKVAVEDIDPIVQASLKTRALLR